MADKMDALLGSIGQEANAKIDFDGALAQILAKAKEQDTEAILEAEKARRSRRRTRQFRTIASMAAGAVVILGAALLLFDPLLLGMGAASGSDAAAPEAVLYSAAEDSTAAAPSLAAAAPEEAALYEEPAAEGAASADQSVAPQVSSSSRITEDAGESQDSIFYGQDSLATPEGDMEGQFCYIGITDGAAALAALEDMGYTAQLLPEEEAQPQLAAGEAWIAQGGGSSALAGGLALWNTGEAGYLRLNAPGLTQEQIYNLLLSL